MLKTSDSSDIPHTTLGTKTDESQNKTRDLRSNVKKNVITGTSFCINSIPVSTEDCKEVCSDIVLCLG